jgi:hypothetical protein
MLDIEEHLRVDVGAALVVLMVVGLEDGEVGGDFVELPAERSSVELAETL